MDKPFLKRLFLTGIVTSLVCSALAGIMVLILGTFDDTSTKVLLTTLSIGVFSVASLAMLRNLESKSRSYHLFAVTGLMVSAGALLLILLTIWGSIDYDGVWKTAATLSILAISAAHASLLLPLREKGIATARSVTDFTLVFIAAVAGMLVYLVWSSDAWDISDTFWRALGVFAILDVLGTVVGPLLAKFYSKPAGGPPQVPPTVPGTGPSPTK
jgi:hypothetical protein